MIISSCQYCRVLQTIHHASMDKAVRYGLVIFNPTHGAILPRYSHAEMALLDSNQLNPFLSAANGIMIRQIARALIDNWDFVKP